MQTCVFGLVDHAHSTAAKFLEDAIVGDGLADKGVGVRHGAVQACVVGLVNHTHPAPAQLLDDSVVGDGLADKGVGVRHSAAILAPEASQRIRKTS